MSLAHALITGGSSGLGLAIARQLGAAGHPLVLVARDATRLIAAREGLASEGLSVTTYAGDVSSAESLGHVAESLKREHTVLDFLVLNAGVVCPGLLLDADDLAEQKSMIDTCLWGAILGARLFGPMLRSGGRVLIVSSGFGLLGSAGYAAYCAAKAGLVNFGEALRREWMGRGVSVYVACPADIDTPQFAYEQARMPAWMRVAEARGKVLSPDEAARRILRRCRGSRQLILINSEVKLVRLLSRLLPARLLQLVLDRALPLPPPT